MLKENIPVALYGETPSQSYGTSRDIRAHTSDASERAAP